MESIYTVVWRVSQEWSLTIDFQLPTEDLAKIMVPVCRWMPHIVLHAEQTNNYKPTQGVKGWLVTVDYEYCIVDLVIESIHQKIKCWGLPMFCLIHSRHA